MFTAKNFNIKELAGISAKNIEEHLKLYAGYVKHANLCLSKVAELKDEPDNIYATGEINRRFGFEYNGMRNHETYFALLEKDATPINETSGLYQAITMRWGSYDAWLAEFKAITLTRGIGWAILYYDYENKILMNAWVDEQHIGQLQNCKLIVALDMWEHAYVYDYATSEKAKYIEAFFANLDWSVAESNFLG
ncbi:MAG: Fe-Mn family superoxide dismutase [Candidatus Pacebacteria bacterium]|nr:Fe-Mn family superoxide dismutase [Candidatus Paceibacterota bacterium]